MVDMDLDLISPRWWRGGVGGGGRTEGERNRVQEFKDNLPCDAAARLSS